MLTSVWGPSMWHYLHTMSFNYPVRPTPEQRKHYYSFMKSLVNVLPCKYCRINLKTNYKNLPLRKCDMKNRESFSKYVYYLHELVNKMLKKKSGLSHKNGPYCCLYIVNFIINNNSISSKIILHARVNYYPWTNHSIY